MENTEYTEMIDPAPSLGISGVGSDTGMQYVHLAHDLKSPASVILNAVNYLEEANKRSVVNKPMLDKYLYILHYATNQILRLSDQVLDAERLRSGELPMNPHAYDLNRFLCALCEVMRQDFEQKGLNLQCMVEPQEIWMICDIMLMERMMMNLLVNAAKYTPSGGSVSITTVTQSQHLAIKVEDTGCGIAPEKQKQIFGRFITGGQPHDGTGLGLFLVWNIVKQHGGEISVTSTPGQGSCFTIRLPLPQEPIDHEDKRDYNIELSFSANK